MPPSAGPSTVECTATMNRRPVSGSWRMTICLWSSSASAMFARRGGWVAMVIDFDLIPGCRRHQPTARTARNCFPCTTNGKLSWPIGRHREERSRMSIAVRPGAAPRRRPSQGERFLRDGDNGGRGRGPLLDISLDDKYLLEEGRILLTGLQGLVRLPLDQHRADRRRGLHTGTMISGYQGSPLGGLDKELARNRKLVEEHHVRHVPGLNEELGATSAWGSQLASDLPGALYDGVLAMWYGKAPGLDRAADSLRHGNFVGVSRTGGALAVVGDDPGCKSSTIPSASESLLAGFRPMGRLQDRHARGRRGRHRRRRPRPGHARHADRRVGRQALRARSEREPAGAGLARHGAHALRAAHGARARLRARERREPDRGGAGRLA